MLTALLLRLTTGRWKNAIVAVKIIETCFEGKMPMDISREPILRWGVSTRCARCDLGCLFQEATRIMGGLRFGLSHRVALPMLPCQGLPFLCGLSKLAAATSECRHLRQPRSDLPAAPAPCSLGAVHPNIVSTFRLAFTCVRRGGPCKEGCEDEAATAAAAACCQTPTTCSGSSGGGGSPADSSAGLAPKTASQSPSTTGDGSGCEAPMPYNYQSSVEGCSSRATTATAPAGEAHGSSGAPVAAAAAGGQGAQPDSVVISPRSQLLDFALQGPFPPG